MSVVHTNAFANMKRFAKRMEDGWRLIEDHKRAGKDTYDLETFWIDLLRQYEIAADIVQGTKRRDWKS